MRTLCAMCDGTGEIMRADATPDTKLIDCWVDCPMCKRKPKAKRFNAVCVACQASIDGTLDELLAQGTCPDCGGDLKLRGELCVR